MSRRLIIFSVFLLSIISVNQAEAVLSVSTKAKTFSKDNSYKSGELLIRLKGSSSINKISIMHNVLHAKVITQFQKPAYLQLVQLPKGSSVEKAIALYKKNPQVAYAEPNYYVHAQVAPSDTKWLEQWALNNVGQTHGKIDADINAPEMWELTKGDREVVVGVIDTGILYTHPDLVDNVWTNVDEIPGNGIDDDGNGFIDDIHGLNAINKKGDPLDDNGHGTHVSGIMGAVGDNNVGISGINQRISIVGCKFLDAGGSGSTSDALLCMEYMQKLKTRTKNPVNLVATNNSWAGGGYSQAMVDAIKAHQDAGILFMAAASNEGNDNDVTETYPSNYNVANIISVAASDHKDELASFSNYGLHTVDVTAPGVDILSTIIGNKYDSYSGTSMATPHVTGMAGLIKSYDSTLDWKAIKNLLISSGDPIEAAKGKTISGRRLKGAGVDGRGVLTCSDQVVKAVLSPNSGELMIEVGNKLDFSIMNINCANPNGVPEIETDVDGFMLTDDGTGNDDVAEDGIYSAQWSPTESGRYTFNLGEFGVVDALVYNPGSWRKYKKDASPDFNYRTIVGTKLDLSDDSVAAVDSPFPIKFAGDHGGFRKVYISSNGTLSFTSKAASNWTNKGLPADDHATLIAPFWDDLNPGSKGGVYYAVSGNAPNRELVVEWRNVEHFSSKNGLTFEVVFFENSSNILFNYDDVMLGSATYDKGASATIGIQINKTAATQIGFNQGLLENKSAILFSEDTSSK